MTKPLNITLILISIFAMSESSVAELVTKVPGQPPGKELKVKKSGVPSYNWTKKSSKQIPLLNVGEEPTLEASAIAKPNTISDKALRLIQIDKSMKLPVVDIKQLLQPKFVRDSTLKEIIKINPQFALSPLKELKSFAEPNFPENNVEEKKVQAFSSVEERILQALILMDYQKQYGIAFGLLSEIIEESKENKNEVLYHYARAAKLLGLHSEHRHQMLKILKDSAAKEWSKKAAMHLAENAVEDDLDLVKILDPKLAEYDIEPEHRDQYLINRARYYSEIGDLSTAIASLDDLDENSKFKLQGTFLKGILNYRFGKSDEALKLISEVWSKLEKEAPSEFKSVVAITKARLEFQKAQYKEAFQSFLGVSKNNPIWLQAMVEQAWSQILSEDYEGAAGNMFTLHTDFFKNAFAPESYIARAVGYLNLCQYGDGAKVVISFNQRYQPMKDMLDQYMSKNKDEANYYATVRSFFKNPQSKIIDGLHRNFIYELAKHPSFTNIQGRVNLLEDEITKFNNISLDLVQTERSLLQKQGELEAKLAKPGNATKEELSKIQVEIANLKVQHQLAKRVRNSMKGLRTLAMTRIENEKTEIKQKAAHALKLRFDEMYSALTKSLDQSEVLRYELYSGAGEHLRYQMAGGEISNEQREALKVKEGKALKWDFKGEVWEDELGHYRSSLKNVCPSETK